MREAIQFLKENLKKNDSIVVGVSGGPDSISLLHVLNSFKEELNLTIICAHVHHNVRLESDYESEFVRDFCKSHEIIFEMMKIESYGDDNFHNEARNIRYQFFEDLLKRYSASILMTAHHADDLMETILMRMVRGSTLKGYSGFSEIQKRSFYTIMRPLLKVTKEDILNYIREYELTYVEDGSNYKDVYTRNRYRKEVLPFLKGENKNVHERFYKFHEILEEASVYIEKEVLKKMDKMVKEGVLSLDSFFMEDSFMQKQILFKMLEQYYQDDLILVSDIHVKLILDLIHSSKPNGFVSLPNEVVGEKEYSYFRFSKKRNKIGSYEIEFTGIALLPDGSEIRILESSSLDNNFICRLDYSDIELPFIIRTKQDGDKMEVKGLNGRAKLTDIFKDHKIPTRQREKYPVLVDSAGKIIWLPGLKKSKFDKTKEEKYDIILWYDKKGEFYE